MTSYLHANQGGVLSSSSSKPRRRFIFMTKEAFSHANQGVEVDQLINWSANQGVEVDQLINWSANQGVEVKSID